ncbi:MAG: hypothetical protein NXI24_01325 [bacterium]|nr:hypothetical protein [bacterium]
MSGLPSILKSPLFWSAALAVVLTGVVFALLSGGPSGGYESGPGEVSDRRDATGGMLDGIFDGDPAATAQAGDDAVDGEAPRPLSQEAQSAEVDLVAVRKALPKNLYWELAAPTEDVAEQKRRRERENEINEQFGRVQANVASEAEIREYYAFQKRRSQDFIEFLSYVIKKHGDELSERDEGLYGLGIELHTARIEHIPRALEEALARKTVHDRKRREWLAGQN